MIVVFVVLALASLFRLYPLAVYDWLDRAEQAEEARYQAEVDRYTREVHQELAGIKAHCKECGYDDAECARMERLCDAYERELCAGLLDD